MNKGVVCSKCKQYTMFAVYVFPDLFCEPCYYPTPFCGDCLVPISECGHKK